jgi:lipopolysaccharide/colanic/teichoic acid biosynthesis glycosyltransferase
MYLKIKRAFDVVCSLLALVLLSPILLITALVIKIDSKGPVIFKQERLGKDGRVFNVYKFRSMTVGAEQGGVYSGKGDARVTRDQH